MHNSSSDSPAPRPRRRGPLWRRSSWLLLGVVALGLTCAVLSFREGGADDGLFLYCGSGIRPALEAMRTEFTAATGIPLRVTYAGSGCLLSMLTFARSGDLYMPGERYYVEQAIADGHLRDPVTVAYFVAVVAVQKGNPKGIRSLADLARQDVRVGIGHPETVACGLAARRILDKAGVWEAVKANVDAQGACTATAMELTNALALNAIDAAINWDATVFPVRDRLDILTIPQAQNVEVPIPLGLLTWSRRTRDAERFIEYALSADAKRCFEAHGYHTSTEPYVLPYYGTTVLE